LNPHIMIILICVLLYWINPYCWSWSINITFRNLNIWTRILNTWLSSKFKIIKCISRKLNWYLFNKWGIFQIICTRSYSKFENIILVLSFSIIRINSYHLEIRWRGFIWKYIRETVFMDYFLTLLSC